jgi:hypothetical protein
MAHEHGREARLLDGNSVWQNWFIGDSKGTQIDATYFFYHSQLQSYLHNLDFDTEYWFLLHSLLDEYGQPQKVEAKQQIWSGPGGGYLTSTSLSWRVGADKITLSFNPEGRDGSGNPRFARSAHVTYEIADARCL